MTLDKNVTIKISKKDDDKIIKEIAKGNFENRSQFFRHVIKYYFKN